MIPTKKIFYFLKMKSEHCRQTFMKEQKEQGRVLQLTLQLIFKPNQAKGILPSSPPEKKKSQ